MVARMLSDLCNEILIDDFVEVHGWEDEPVDGRTLSPGVDDSAHGTIAKRRKLYEYSGGYHNIVTLFQRFNRSGIYLEMAVDNTLHKGSALLHHVDAHTASHSVRIVAVGELQLSTEFGIPVL